MGEGWDKNPIVDEAEFDNLEVFVRIKKSNTAKAAEAVAGRQPAAEAVAGHQPAAEAVAGHQPANPHILYM